MQEMQKCKWLMKNCLQTLIPEHSEREHDISQCKEGECTKGIKHSSLVPDLLSLNYGPS